MPDQSPLRLSFALSSPTLTTDGVYEILAITSSLGNGWKFAVDVLKKSLPLWDGVHCFLDHSLSARSIKDIAGILTDPVFDEESQGIRAILKPFGPGAELLNGLAPILTNSTHPDGSTGQTDYKVGFSADLSFIGGNPLKTAGAGNLVKEIVKVHSVDLVVNPARGGKFLRVMNHETKEKIWKDKKKKTKPQALKKRRMRRRYRRPRRTQADVEVRPYQKWQDNIPQGEASHLCQF